MTYGSNDDGHLTTNQRRESAREKAKALREQRRKKDRRGRLLIGSGILVVTVVIALVVGFVIVDSAKPEGPGPLNMLSDGIRLEEGRMAVPTSALRPGGQPVAHTVGDESEVIDIRIYYDYFAENSKTFNDANEAQLEAWLDSGVATVEIHPLSILNPNSQGTQYSTRSANAAACVANFSPDSYWAVNKALFDKQPEERTAGLSDDELIDLVRSAGVSRPGDIEECIHEQDFKRWVQEATLRALEGPLPGYQGEDSENENKVKGSPTILVNGLVYKNRFDDADAFAAFVVQATAMTFNDSTTPTPTPEPSAAPAD